MRCMLGLDRPERGTTTFDGQPLRDAPPAAARGRRAARRRLRPPRSFRSQPPALAGGEQRLCRRRASTRCSALVGLTEVAKRKVRGYSLGMRQRLGLAGVLLGDPHTVILDEPANGLDPEGIRWIRDVLVHLARQGTHGARQQPPAVGDLADGRRPRRDRPRPADRAGPGRPVHRPPRRAVGAGAHAATRRRSPRALQARRRRRSQPTAPDGIEVYGLPIERVGELAAAATASCCTSCRRRARRWRTPSSGDGRRAGVPLREVADRDRRHPQRVDQALARSLSTWVLAIIAVAFPLVVTVARRRRSPTTSRPARTWPSLVTGLAIVTAMLLGVVATIGVTSEFTPQHDPADVRRDARPAAPAAGQARRAGRRHARADGRHGRASCWLLGARPRSRRRDRRSATATALPALVGVGRCSPSGSTLLGFGLGLLIRNSPAAICILLLWPLIAESL